MRVLFLSQRIPYPPNRGDKITTWRLIDRMRKTHEVTIVAFSHGEVDERATAELRDMGLSVHGVPYVERAAKIRSLPLLLTRRALTLGVYGSRELQGIVDRLAPEMDVGYAYSSSMGAFLLPHPKLRRVMHFAELDSDKWRQYAERTGPPMSWIYRREWKTLRSFETELAHSFDQNIFCTPLEEDIFQTEIPGAASMVLRNGVDLDFFRPAPELTQPNEIVFTGVMDYYPNVDGCVFFADKIFPQVRAAIPDAQFTIVGSNPTPEIQRLGERPGIAVTGFVDDVRDYLRRASLAVAPLRIARGIQNKVLEALAMGLPVVGTTSATQGIEGQPGRDFLLADDPNAFAEDCIRLLQDATAAREQGERGRRFVEDNYDWNVVLEPLDATLDPTSTT